MNTDDISHTLGNLGLGNVSGSSGSGGASFAGAPQYGPRASLPGLRHGHKMPRSSVVSLGAAAPPAASGVVQRTSFIHAGGGSSASNLTSQSAPLPRESSQQQQNPGSHSGKVATPFSTSAVVAHATSTHTAHSSSLLGPDLGSSSRPQPSSSGTSHRTANTPRAITTDGTLDVSGSDSSSPDGSPNSSAPPAPSNQHPHLVSLSFGSAGGVSGTDSISNVGTGGNGSFFNQQQQHVAYTHVHTTAGGNTRPGSSTSISHQQQQQVHGKGQPSSRPATANRSTSSPSNPQLHHTASAGTAAGGVFVTADGSDVVVVAVASASAPHSRSTGSRPNSHGGSHAGAAHTGSSSPTPPPRRLSASVRRQHDAAHGDDAALVTMFDDEAQPKLSDGARSRDWQPKARCCGVSLGVVIGIIFGCLLAVLAVVTFQLVYDASLNALNDVGLQHAGQIGETVATRFGSQINATTAAMSALQLMIARCDGPQPWTLPSDFNASTAPPGSTWHDRWATSILDSSLTAIFAVTTFIFRLADNSWLTMSLRSPSFVVYVRSGESTLSADGSSETLYNEKSFGVFGNGTRIPNSSSLAINPDPTDPTVATAVGGTLYNIAKGLAADMGNGLDQLNTASSVAGIQTNVTPGAIFFNEAGSVSMPTMAAPVEPRGIWFSITTVSFLLSGTPTQFMMAPLVVPLLNASRHYLGFAMATVNMVNFINPILQDTASTLPGGSSVYILDMLGYLMGSTDGTIYSEQPRVAGSSVPDNCAFLDSASSGSTVQIINCRYKAVLYRASLAAAGQKFLLSSTPQASLIRDADGERYYIASVPLHNSYTSFAMSIVTVIRQTAIIGEVSKTRRNNIGIVAGCVCGSFLIALYLVWRLLAPLRDVANRMDLAAALEDNEDAGLASFMSEVAALQRAYFAMNAELQRLKGFVPQSVLLQNVHRRRVLRIKRFAEAKRLADLDDPSTCRRLLRSARYLCCGDHTLRELEERMVSRVSLSANPSCQQSLVDGDDVEEEDNDEVAALMNNRRVSLARPARGQDDAATATSSVKSGYNKDRSLGASHSRAPSKAVDAAVGESLATPRRGVDDARSTQAAPPVVSPAIVPRAPGASNASDALSMRAVTAVAINVVGFHGVALRDSSVRLPALAEQLTSIVVAAAGAERGVVDSFLGDHFLLTFNAAAACATHVVRGPRCALNIADSVADMELPWHVTIGIGSGTSRCGTLGCRDSRRFSIIGPAVPHAFMLEQHVRRHPNEHLWRRPLTGDPYRIAVPQAMLEDLRPEFQYECIDVVALPSARPNTLGVNPYGSALPGLVAPLQRAAFYSGGGIPGSVDDKEAALAATIAAANRVTLSAVAQILGEHDDEDRAADEWMYQLESRGAAEATTNSVAAVTFDGGQPGSAFASGPRRQSLSPASHHHAQAQARPSLFIVKPPPITVSWDGAVAGAGPLPGPSATGETAKHRSKSPENTSPLVLDDRTSVFAGDVENGPSVLNFAGPVVTGASGNNAAGTLPLDEICSPPLGVVDFDTLMVSRDGDGAASGSYSSPDMLAGGSNTSAPHLVSGPGDQRVDELVNSAHVAASANAPMPSTAAAQAQARLMAAMSSSVLRHQRQFGAAGVAPLPLELTNTLVPLIASVGNKAQQHALLQLQLQHQPARGSRLGGIGAGFPMASAAGRSAAAGNSGPQLGQWVTAATVFDAAAVDATNWGSDLVAEFALCRERLMSADLTNFRQVAALREMLARALSGTG